MGEQIILEQEERWKRQRCAVSAFCFAVPVLVLVMYWYFDSLSKIFYTMTDTGIGSLYRLMWCAFGSLWGFSTIAFNWRNVKKSPFPDYLTYYPFLLLVITLFTFSSLHLFEKTSGYLFYYFSFGLCALLGFQVDQFWKFIDAILEKAKSKIIN